ncbi:hypothetical protein HK098_000331 [Nowakowskiella sp. JEL0407]|nr:hypothetical protein HK098_000331 [Nowakowskiella sp. JEL0407]
MVNVEMLVLYFGLSYADMSLKEFDAGGNSSVEKGGTPKGGKVVTNTTSTVKTVDDICRVCANVKSMDVKMKLWFANIWDRLQNAKSITQTSPGKFELIESDKLLRILTSLNALENKRKPIDPISIAQDINSTTITDEEITIQIWIRLAKCAHQIGNNEVAFECLQNISEEKLYKKPKLSGLFYFVKGKVLKSLYSEKKFTASQNLMGFEIVECFTSALEVIVSQVHARVIGVSEILVEIWEWIQETGVKNSTQCDFVADKVSKAFLNPLLDNSFWHEFMKSDGGKLLLQILSFFKGRAGCVDDKEAEKLVRCIPLKYRTYKIEDEPPKSGSSRPVSSKSKNYSDSFVASMKKIENLVFNRNKINSINEEVNDLQTCFDTVKELLTIFTSYCGSKPFEETTTVRIKSAGQKDGKRSKETAELEKSRTITTENEWLISGWNEYSIFCAKNLFELCAGSKQNIELLCKLWLYVLSYACQKFSKYELYSQNLAILNLMDLISCSAFDSKSLYSNWNYAIYNSVGNALNQTNRSAVGIKWYAKATMFTLESPIFHSEVHVEDLQMYLFAIRVLIDKGSLDSAAEVHSFATSFNHLDLNEWWILGTEIALKSRRYQTAIESASKFPGTLSSENYFRVLELFEECIDEYTPNILLVHIFSMMQHNIATFKNRSLDDIWMKRTKGRVLGLLGKLFSQIALNKNQFEQLLEEIRKIFKSTTFGKGVDEKFLELSVNSDVYGISEKTTTKIISNLIELSVRFYTKSFEICEQCEDVFGASKTINQFAKSVAEITNLTFFLPEKMDTFTMRKMILNCRDILKRGKVFLENVECLPSDIFSKWKERIFVEFQIAIEDLNAEICYSIENLEEKKLQKNREYLIQKFLSENEEMIAINKEWDETKATICEEVQTGNLKFEKTLRSDLRHALKQKNELMFRISEDTTDQTAVWKEITASLTECLQSFIGQKNFLFAYVACLEAFELSINRRFEVEHQTAFSLLATLQSCANSISAKQILKNIGSNQFRNGRRLLDFSSSDSPKKFDLQTQIGYYQTTDKIFSEIKPSTPSAIEELLKSAPKNVQFVILQHSIDGKRLYYGVYANIRTTTTPSAGKKQSQKSPEESNEIYVKAGCVHVSLEERNELLKLIKLQEKVMKESVSIPA